MTKHNYYTGIGDRGDTARLGGMGRISKSSVLVNTIGALDEVTCAIGVVRSLAKEPTLATDLITVQRHLSALMSHLSAVPEMRERYSGVPDEALTWLEALIARLSDGVPWPEGFVLPGDSSAGAACHMARAIVRRAERNLVAFVELEEGIGSDNLAYVNRLSSLMFVTALREDMLAGRSSTKK